MALCNPYGHHLTTDKCHHDMSELIFPRKWSIRTLQQIFGVEVEQEASFCKILKVMPLVSASKLLSFPAGHLPWKSPSSTFSHGWC